MPRPHRLARPRRGRPTSCAAGAPRRSRAARSPPHRRRGATRSPARCAGSRARTSRSREPSSQRRISSTCNWVLRSPLRSSWWLATSSLDEAERDELHPDDEHPQRQERACWIASPVSRAPSGSRVEVRPSPRAAGRGHRRGGSGHAVVATHEGHGEQVEEPAHVALHPVAGAAVLAWPVVDGEFGDTEATGSGRAPG